MVEGDRQSRQSEDAWAAADQRSLACDKKTRKKARQAVKRIEDRRNSINVESEEEEGSLIMECEEAYEGYQAATALLTTARRTAKQDRDKKLG